MPPTVNVTAEEEALEEERATLARLQEKNAMSFDKLLGGTRLVGDTGRAPKGVFADFPAATPKYRTSPEGATETMARIMVPFSSDTSRERFIQALPSGDARELGKALAVTKDMAAGTTLGAGFGDGLGYIDFLLQNVQETYQEKVQVVDVLSDNYIAYFFGQEPPVFAYQGTLLNTYQDDWRAAFSVIYSEILRGTKLVRRRRLMTLTYDNVAVTGTMINMSQTLTADMEMASSFTFNMLVKRYDIYRLPNTKFNPATQFTDVMGKLIDPNTFTGLKLGAVKRTYRTLGEPTIKTSVPKKDKGNTAGKPVKTPLQPGSASNIKGSVPEADINVEETASSFLGPVWVR